KELSKYTGFKCSYIYKLAHRRLIPYSKPSGKMLFFERVKIDNWLLTNSSPSNSEVEKNLVKKIMKE
ncbi:helix-turn-helix transcriptional regulator, partial [Epilithonimonas sp.]|uniref:helix-turn-helix transcriptional regulator n=1 Tax=Epilithonimonas sp. TaxID=2894511 RepID=UPI002FDCF0C2